MSQSTTIEQAEGYPTVHIWQNDDGEVWACCAYDHGPMCRLCQRADQVMLDCLQNVADGKMFVRANADGEFQLKVTALGEAAAEDLIMSDLEMAALWAQLEKRR